MAVQVEELYTNLKSLLQDICKFLGNEVDLNQLSPSNRAYVNQLIQRSKSQLEQIAKVTTDCDGAYVDMTQKSDSDDKSEIYSSVCEEVQVKTETKPQLYADLPAKSLCKDLKYGQLSWKTRFILSFEKTKRIIGGIHHNWLLIYSSERDCKPLMTFDLKFHKARIVPCKQNKNYTQDFELYCPQDDKKIYFFIALTPKDMLQWVSYINSCYDSINDLNSTNNKIEDDQSESYDSIINFVDRNQKPVLCKPKAKEPEIMPEEIKPELPKEDIEDDDEGESIYEQLEINETVHIVVPDKPPDLPLRRPFGKKPNIPLPLVPSNQSIHERYSSESISSDYDAIDIRSKEISESENEFSDPDDEDNIYEPFVNVNALKNSVIDNNKTITNVNINNNGKPVVKEKPKNLLTRKN